MCRKKAFLAENIRNIIRIFTSSGPAKYLPCYFLKTSVLISYLTQLR